MSCRSLWTWEVVVTYVEVTGLPTWHEVRGEGQPVVLPHGAFAGASSRSGQTPALARTGYTVYAKTLRMLATEPELDLASLATVGAPTPCPWRTRRRVLGAHPRLVGLGVPGQPAR